MSASDLALPPDVLIQLSAGRPLLLIVDDQPSNIQVLYAIFKIDHDVCMATSGADALAFCLARQPDLILLDVVMPDMDGYAVCRELKNNPLTSHIPVIFVTGQNDPLVEARGLDEGGVDFISKPFHERVVRARVRTHLILKWQTDELRVKQLELRQRQAELEAVHDASPLALFHIDIWGGCTYVNRAYEQMSGMVEGAALGLGWRRQMDPDEVALLLATCSGLTNAQQHYDGTHRFRHIDGGTVVAQVRVAPIVIDDVVTGYVGTAEDVTERRAADAALAANEKRLRVLTDGIPALICYIGIEEQFQFCNIHYERLLGLHPEKILGKTLLQVYGDDAYAEMAPHVAAVLAGNSVSYERSLRIDEREWYLQSEYVPDLGQDGQVLGFYAMVTDVTQRRVAEKNLAAGERRLRTITDNLPVAISYMDTSQRFHFANPTLYAWTGTTPETVLGKSLLEVMGPDLYEERRVHLERALAGERVDFTTTSTMVGQEHHLQSIYLPDMAADGQVKGVYTLSNDITVLKKTEHDLRRLAREDSLTGLPNRAHLYDALNVVLTRNRRRGGAIAVLFLDIDHFKLVNDRFGHAIGDLVLQEFATRLTKSVRTTDLVARLAGDEFVIILEGLGATQEAHRIAEKILQLVGKPWLLNGEKLDITTSIGIAFDEACLRSGAELLSDADAALYEAKSAGRNTFRSHVY